ncbi:MAG: PEGA domain-containing protein [Parvularculaceae bacterium]
MRLVVVLAAFALSGCMTIGGGASTRNIITEPPGALVTFENGATCETPCTVKLDKPQKIRVAKAGFVSTSVVISPGGGAVKVPLELAAASEGVDTEALPELN